jgi:hypothetical protein
MGGFLVYSGHGTEGLTALVTAIIALVGAFVYGTNSRKSERMQKAQRQEQLRERPGR